MQVGERGSGTSLWQHVVAGSASRCTVEAFMSPFHMLKVRQQHSAALGPRSAWQWPATMWRAVREEGVGIWRGLPPRLMWVAPLSSVMFVYYELAASIFRAKTEGSGHVASSTWAAAAAGPAALAIGTAIRTPFDIVEQRRQLVAVGEGGKIMHMTPRQHIAAIYRAEGLPAVLCGASATFLMSTAFLATYFLVYEGVKTSLLHRWSASPGRCHLVAGGAAGFVAAAVSTPIDTIKTRMQTGAAAAAAESTTGVAGGSATLVRPTLRGTVASLVREHGAQALWRGLGPRLAAFTPAGALTLGSYELYKRWLGKLGL